MFSCIDRGFSSSDRSSPSVMHSSVLNTIFALIVFFGVIIFNAFAEPIEDKQALLDFIAAFPHYSPKINWVDNTSTCSAWIGVTCNADQTRVVALHLPGVGFTGQLPPNTLDRLSALQTLSLRANYLNGSFPLLLLKLGSLKAVYLQFNSFSGPLPLNFSAWNKIKVIDLSNNRFNGSLPSSISNLTHLTSLDISNNLLSGEIPDIQIPSSLVSLNLSSNNLTGLIPKSFQRFPASAFDGNNLSPEIISPSIPPAFPPISKTSKRLSKTALLGILVGGCLLVFMAVAACIAVCCSRKGSKNGGGSATRAKEKKAIKNEKSEKMTFFEGSNMVFELEDLLGASAEMLGKGTFGVTYKAVLEDARTVVVKRLKVVGSGKRDFEQLMGIIGSIKHENVAAPVAYYYSKDEKLMVYDFFSSGSISTLLHGNRGENRTPLAWDTRLRLATGGAKGLAHIHTQNGGKLIHGNIKSSNIFLNPNHHGCVSDVALATILTPLIPSAKRTPGYGAPEVRDRHRATQASDVYSFGVVLLELLTGKSAVGEGVNLVKWVNMVVREEWTSEVFDVELLRYSDVEQEMVRMLQLGISCTLRAPDKRPTMAVVATELEKIRDETSNGSTPSSAYHAVASV